MSGLGLVLSIAKDALAAQRYGMDVTGHNIANVNTPGYSRQSPVYEAKEPAPYGGVLLGRGVETTHIARACDQFIENRLMQQKSNMLSFKEMENYIQVLEGLFNENSESSISKMLTDFWNSWHDIANNPSGSSERIALYEHSILLSEQFNTLNTDLTQLETDLTNAVSAGIEKINQITNEVGILNGKIVGMEASNIANDLRDQRNILVSELSEYLGVNTFEQDNGSLTVATARGCILVHGNNSYDLELGGDNGDRVKWQGSGGATVDITSYITSGKLDGWLNMRDEVIAKYKLDLDTLAKEFIWAVNQQHSQGVGLQLFSSSVTGTYKTGSSGLLETLAYGNKIDYTKDFKMWTYDSGSTAPVPVAIDMAISSADPNYTHANTVFLVASTTYTIEVTQGGTVGTDKIQFEWSQTGGTSGTGTLAAGATTAILDDGTSQLEFSAGELIAGNTLKINTLADKSPAPVLMTPTETANSILDTYTFTVASGSGGEIGTDSIQIGWSNSITSGTFTLDAAATPVDVDGMTLTFTSGYLFANDVFTITTDADGAPTANLLSEWHWTLDSFVNQFNRQTPRITASKTSDNALMFAPYTSGTDRELTNIDYSGGVTSSNATVTVNNCDALTIDTAVGTPFKLSWDSGTSSWSISGDPGYAAVVLSGDDSSVRVDMNGNGSADITVDFAPALTADGYVEFDIALATGTYSFAFSDDEAQDSGLMAALGINTFLDGRSAGSIGTNSQIQNKDYIAAAQIVANTGDLAVGDNTNALAIADLQYTSSDIAQWMCDRINGNAAGSVTTTIETYYHSMVGTIGITSASISRGSAFNEVIVNKLSEIRDSISAVSLDEEMTNIIKFQHAYAAAAKLISVSDEMLNTLLNVK